MNRVAIIDFETTGLRAGPDRVIEVAAAVMQDGAVVDTFSALMNPGFPIPRFITEFTGISNAMVRDQPSPEAVMPRLRAFLGNHVCIAHNASFDQRFFSAEMALADQRHERSFLCSMLLARRLVQQAPNHQLGTLIRHLRLSCAPSLRAHRALDDVLMTCQLWQHLLGMLRRRIGGRPLELPLLQGIVKKPKALVDEYLASLAVDAGHGRAQCG